VVDSTGVMELVAFVEAEFGVKVEPQEIVVENFDSVRKVAGFIRRKLPQPKVNGALVTKPLVSEPAAFAQPETIKL
jgi:hypothetical protein